MIWTIDSEVFSFFDSLNIEFSPSSYFINTFPSCFLFYHHIKYKNNNLKDYANQLNNIAIMTLVNHLNALIILDVGIKNNIVTSITYVHIHNKFIIKTVHYVVNVTFTEAELFAIRCSINQATNILGILKIIIITDSIYYYGMLWT